MHQNKASKLQDLHDSSAFAASANLNNRIYWGTRAPK